MSQPGSCASCGAESAPGKRFCADCGAPLEQTADSMRRLIDQRLDARLTDRKLVEIETAQAIVSRVTEWAKLFGYFVALPLGLVVLALAVLGFQQYSDFRRLIEAGKQDLARQIDAIKSGFEATAKLGEKAKSEGEQLNRDIAEIRKQLDVAQVKRLREDIENLSTRVTGIERRFSFDRSSVPSEVEPTLTSALKRFADYLEAIGFETKRTPATVGVSKDVGANVYYSINDRKVMVGQPLVSTLAKDPSMVLWPYVQHVMGVSNAAVVRSSSEVAHALISAFPDYFVSSYLGTPRIGEGFPGAPKGYLRTLDNDRKFDSKPLNPYDAGEIWAGAFWTIRRLIDKDRTDRLLCDAWKGLLASDVADTSGATFARRLLTMVNRVDGGAHTAAVRAALEARGLKL